MAEWSVKPLWKKSIIERQEWTKDGQTFIYETGWRWGEFTVYTDDDNPPKLEAGVDMYCCDYETELVETTDGCWDDYDYDGCDEETQQWLEEFFEEGNSVFDLEEHGWYCGDTEMIIDCDLEITRVDGDSGLVITTGNQETEVAPALAPIVDEEAKWPFFTEVVEAIEKSSELTDWFPASTSPVRNGEYQVIFDKEEVKWPFESNVHAAEWDGKKWDVPVSKKVTQWRGLAKDPGAK